MSEEETRLLAQGLAGRSLLIALINVLREDGVISDDQMDAAFDIAINGLEASELSGQISEFSASVSSAILYLTYPLFVI